MSGTDNAIPLEDTEDAFSATLLRKTFYEAGRTPRQTAKSRKAKEKKLRSAIDGRSLREAVPRLQWNIKVLPEIKDRAILAAKKADMTIQDWLEEVILTATGGDAAGA